MTSTTDSDQLVGPGTKRKEGVVYFCINGSIISHSKICLMFTNLSKSHISIKRSPICFYYCMEGHADHYLGLTPYMSTVKCYR